MTDVVKDIEEVRRAFLQVRQSLEGIASFQSLQAGSLKVEWEFASAIAECRM